MESSRRATANGSRTRSGSYFADKQIAHTVKDGKAIEVLLPDGNKVIGWVFGADNYHWGLVSLFGDVILVHKSAPMVTVTEHMLSKQDADHRRDIESLVAPFRDYVMREHFGQTAVPAT